MLEHQKTFLWSDSARDFVKAERAKNPPTPYKQIADYLGTTKNTVLGWAYRNSLCAKQRKLYEPTRNPFLIADLSERPVCVYPIGHPSDADFHICGAVADKPPFCAAHREICYLKTKPHEAARKAA